MTTAVVLLAGGAVKEGRVIRGFNLSTWTIYVFAIHCRDIIGLD